MTGDWKGFSPAEPPKQTTSDSDADELGVLPEREAWPGLGEVPFGGKRVFKKGYPTGKSIGFTGARMVTNKFEPTSLTRSKPTSLLDTHGVADSSKIVAVLHPEKLSLMDSIVRQEAVLVTEDLKMVDISAHAWPIDLDKVPDARTQLRTPVRYGGELGLVAGCQGDLIMFRSATETKMVPMQDVEIAPGKAIVEQEPEQLKLGDEVTTKDLSFQGQIIGLADWPTGQRATVRWQPSGAEVEVDAVHLIKAVKEEAQT